MTVNSFLKSFGVPVGTILAWICIAAGAVHFIDGQILDQTKSFDEGISKLEQRLNGRVDGINQQLEAKIDSLDKRTASLKAAVEAINQDQTSKTKDLVRQLLLTAQQSLPQRPEVAIRAITVASSLIDVLKNQKRTSDQAYFQQTVAQLNRLTGSINEPRLVQTVYLVRLSLAEYRSVLERRFEIGAIVKFVPMENGVIIGGVGNSMTGLHYDFSTLTGDGIRLAKPPLHGTLAENNTVRYSMIKGGIQTLDGIHWRNVVFIGTHIRYYGGEVELQDVQFIDCTFDIPFNERAIKVTDYAALKQSHLVIPS